MNSAYDGHDPLCWCPVCTPKPVRIERWKSSEQNEEIHFFVKGTQIYLAGFNPQLIPEEKIREILKEAGFEL